jgi:hypothetical protein
MIVPKLDTSPNSVFKQMEAFAIERHAIYLRRASGLPAPWTDDPILRKGKFANIFRELDRTTVWIREHIREPFAEHPNLWFMIVLARFFNRADCLEDVIASAWPTDDRWTPKKLLKVLQRRKTNNQLVWNPAAYNIYSPRVFGTSITDYTCSNVFPVLWKQHDEIGSWLDSKPTCTNVDQVLKQYPSFGSFMSAQVIYDLMHTRYLINASDRDTWAGCGPGSVRGLNRLYNREIEFRLWNDQRLKDHDQHLDEINQIRRLIRWPRNWPKLTAHDVENGLCEFDKYRRAKDGGRLKSFIPYA